MRSTYLGRGGAADDQSVAGARVLRSLPGYTHGLTMPTSGALFARRSNAAFRSDGAGATPSRARRRWDRASANARERLGERPRSSESVMARGYGRSRAKIFARRRSLESTGRKLAVTWAYTLGA
jgi:hypothetical protein